VCFHAYATAVYFAVRQQAQAYVEDWLDLLRRHELMAAGLETLPPDRRHEMKDLVSDDPEKRRKIETLLKSIEGATTHLNKFRQLLLVRLLLQAEADETSFVSKG